VPVIIHRMIPPDAEVCYAAVTRRRLADRWIVTVQLTLRLPNAVAPTSGPCVAVHLGWRAVDGGVRVATYAANAPLPEPRAWLVDNGVVVRRDERSGEIRLPHAWIDRMRKMDEIQSVRDRSATQMRMDLIEWADGPGRDVVCFPGEMAKWRSNARFATLAAEWAAAASPPDDAVRDVLVAWAKQDRHLWQWIEHESDQLIGRRRDAWAQVAAWLAGNAQMLAVDDMNIADLARSKEDDDPQTVRARSNRQLAAPGELRSSITQAARRRSVPVEVRAIESGVHECGAELTGDRVRSVTVWCPRCQKAVDQDLNVAEKLLSSAVGELQR
jgi:hypothetical protein